LVSLQINGNYSKGRVFSIIRVISHSVLKWKIIPLIDNSFVTDINTVGMGLIRTNNGKLTNFTSLENLFAAIYLMIGESLPLII